jgi:hypothetical protein
MLCTPKVSAVVEKDATPEVTWIDGKELPALSVKTTVPVGAVTPETAVRVAVRVSFDPICIDGTDAMSRIEVLNWSTDTTTTAEVAVVSFPSPPSTAVIGCVPTASGVVVVNCATPEITLPVPMTAPLSLNVTMPLAVAGVNVAVKVSLVPTGMLVACACRVTVEEIALTITVTAAEVAVVSFPSPP